MELEERIGTVLTVAIDFSCKDLNRTYLSKTGKPFTGKVVDYNDSESIKINAVAEITYEDGNILEAKAIHKSVKIIAVTKYDSEGNRIGLVYYDLDGNSISKEEF